MRWRHTSEAGSSEEYVLLSRPVLLLPTSCAASLTSVFTLRDCSVAAKLGVAVAAKLGVARKEQFSCVLPPYTGTRVTRS